MFSKKFQRKYALTDQGVRNAKKGTFWTVIVNLIVMGGVSVLYLMMSGFMGTLTEGDPLPSVALAIGLVVLFVILSFVTHLQQYKATYGLVYNEVKATRLSLGGTTAQAALGILRQAGSGRLDRNPHGGRQPHGARLEPCTGVSVRRLYFHGSHRCLPARV